MILSCGGVSAIANFIDIPSALYVTLTSFIVLVISGLWKDFWKAFRLGWGKQSVVDESQVKKSHFCLLYVRIDMLYIRTVSFGSNKRKD